jgi:hypothetical protein
MARLNFRNRGIGLVHILAMLTYLYVFGAFLVNLLDFVKSFNAPWYLNPVLVTIGVMAYGATVFAILLFLWGIVMQIIRGK